MSSQPASPSASPTSTSIFTRAVHAGLEPDPVTGAILTPIYQTTTFVVKDPEREQRFRYSRSTNPTVEALERNLAALEGAPLPALAFSSGLAALTTLMLAVLRAGDRVVATDVVYGGSFRLLRQLLHGFGVASDFVDTSRPEALAEALDRGPSPPARLVLLESPSNPTLKLTDLATCAAIARARGALVAVDNTFLTPCLQRPFELGADAIVHSTTKYLDGHNATIGGALLVQDPDLASRLSWTRQAAGGIQTPFNAWLTI